MLVLFMVLFMVIDIAAFVYQLWVNTLQLAKLHQSETA